MNLKICLLSVGDVAEQVVPSTPLTSLQKNSPGMQWVDGASNPATSENDCGRKEQSTYKREFLLKQRLSPRSKPLSSRPISLFSSDDIFSQRGTRFYCLCCLDNLAVPLDSCKSWVIMCNWYRHTTLCICLFWTIPPMSVPC